MPTPTIEYNKKSFDKHPIQKHWIMTLRRVYLTWNVLLASLLILLQGFSFGIQLFYVFRLAEIEDGKSPNSARTHVRVICYQISVVGMMGITCFAFASLMSKSVQFIRMIWSEEQMYKISQNTMTFLKRFQFDCSIPRWFDLLIQFILLVFLELVPFLTGIIVTIIYMDIETGLQGFISMGIFVTLIVLLLWWFGSIFANYRRLVMFFITHKQYVERMVNTPRVRPNHSRRNSGPSLRSRLGSMADFVKRKISLPRLMSFSDRDTETSLSDLSFTPETKRARVDSSIMSPTSNDKANITSNNDADSSTRNIGRISSSAKRLFDADLETNESSSSMRSESGYGSSGKTLLSPRQKRIASKDNLLNNDDADSSEVSAKGMTSPRRRIVDVGAQLNENSSNIEAYGSFGRIVTSPRLKQVASKDNLLLNRDADSNEQNNNKITIPVLKLPAIETINTDSSQIETYGRIVTSPGKKNDTRKDALLANSNTDLLGNSDKGITSPRRKLIGKGGESNQNLMTLNIDNTRGFTEKIIIPPKQRLASNEFSETFSLRISPTHPKEYGTGNNSEYQITLDKVESAQPSSAAEFLNKGATLTSVTSPDALSVPATRYRANSFVKLFHSEDPLASPIPGRKNSLVDISTERNLWLVLAWYFCFTSIGVPNLVRRWKNVGDKSKVYFLIRDLWIVLGLVVFAATLIILFIIQKWRFYALTLIVLGCVVFDMLLHWFIFIPAHNPDRKRLRRAWNSSIIQRYIVFTEEALYLSPEIVFKCFKLVTYILINGIIMCSIFDLSKYYLIFLIPTFISAYICLLYILRFNINDFIIWIKNRLSRFRRYPPIEKVVEDDVAAETTDTLSNSSSIPRISFKGLPAEEKKEKAPSYFHTQSENAFFRILSVYSYTFIFFILFLILLIITSVSVSWTSGLIMLGLLFSISFIVFKRFEKDTGGSFLGFFLFYVVIIGFVFVLGEMNYASDVSRNYALVGHALNGTREQPYEICNSRWYGYSIVDYGFFANLAYYGNPYFMEDFNTWFPDCQDCQLKYVYNEIIFFYDMYIPSKNLSVIGIRGTATPQDMVQDLDIWKEAGLLQALNYISPLAAFWPQKLTIDIIYWIYRIELIAMSPTNEPGRFYYQSLEDYVNSIKNNRTVVLVGHSLGGGLAKIVGVKCNLPSISFSAPGITFSSRKFNLNVKSINRLNISVRPATDLVPSIDKEDGLVQNIDCGGTFVQCHSLILTVQELIRSCTSMDNGLDRWIQ